MTKEDIIRMAKEAGPLIRTPFDVWCERFAALVRADEREACAKVCDEYAQNSSNPMNFAENCAKSIRARGQA